MCHSEHLHFMLDHCHYHGPSPSTLQAVTLPSEQGTLHRASTFAFHHCYLGGLRSHHLLLPAPCVPVLLRFGFSSDSVQHYYYSMLHFIILKFIFFVTFTPTLHSTFLINRNCLVIFKSNKCIFAHEYKTYIKQPHSESSQVFQR